MAGGLLDLAEAASLLIEAAVGRSFFLDFVLVLLLYEVFNIDEAPAVVAVTPPRFESLEQLDTVDAQSLNCDAGAAPTFK